MAVSGPWDGAALECKIRAAGRPWTVCDITMVAGGQWVVRARPKADRREAEKVVVELRITDGRTSI